MNYSLTRLMAITEADFFRLLPRVLTGAEHCLPRKNMTIPYAGGYVHIHLSILPDRKIGSLELPELALRLAFENLSTTEQAAFMRRFDTAFQRGGG